MTAISLINPYAPQPAVNAYDGNGLAAVQAMQPPSTAKDSNTAGQSSDQSGQGAGNGSGTGGAQLAALLKKGREVIVMQRPTPESVVEAQSESDPATEFLARLAQQKAEAQAAAKVGETDRLAKEAEDTKAEEAQAAEPDYTMPNPLPTAPILQREEP